MLRRVYRWQLEIRNKAHTSQDLVLYSGKKLRVTQPRREAAEVVAQVAKMKTKGRLGP